MSFLMGPNRYTTVSWLWQSDLEEGRDACWHYGEGDAREHRSAWRVKVFEQRSTHTALIEIHAERGNGNDGGVITLAIRDGSHLPSPKPMDMRLLSGGMRSWRDLDCWREDGC